MQPIFLKVLGAHTYSCRLYLVRCSCVQVPLQFGTCPHAIIAEYYWGLWVLPSPTIDDTTPGSPTQSRPNSAAQTLVALAQCKFQGYGVKE